MVSSEPACKESKMAFRSRSSAHKQRYAKLLRQFSTQSEQQLWEALRKTSWGKDVLRQQRVLGWIADLYFVRQSLVIEIDGDIHQTRLLTDLHRDRVMEGRGMRVLRIPAMLVSRDIDGVLEQIRAALLLQADLPLPLGAQLWKQLREKPQRGERSIQRLNQRLFLANQYSEGTALYTHWLSETDFRFFGDTEKTAKTSDNADASDASDAPAPELEKNASSTMRELWLAGWLRLVMPKHQEEEAPDLLFFHHEKIIGGLLLLPPQQITRFLREEASRWDALPYPCLIVPICEALYRSEQPWHYGQPLPALQRILGSPPPDHEYFFPQLSHQAIAALRREEFAALAAEEEEAAPPKDDLDIHPETTEKERGKEQQRNESENEDAETQAREELPKTSQGLPILPAQDRLYAFRIVDLYDPEGKAKREIFWVLSMGTPQMPRYRLTTLNAETPLAEADNPPEEALPLLSQRFRAYLHEQREAGFLVDSPMSWQRIPDQKARRALQKALQWGHYPQRFLWKPTQGWYQPPYAKALRWDQSTEEI